MPVRPLMLPDTVSVAGFEHLDPITMWFLGGSGTAGATATGISDDDRYGLDLVNSGSGGNSFRTTSGNGTYQLRVNNSGIALVGGMSVTGTTTFYSPVVMNSTLSVTGAATFASAVTMQSTLTVTGGVVFRDSLVVTGTASFLGLLTAENVEVGDSLTVDNDVTVGSSLAVTGNATFTGTGRFLGDLTVGTGASSSFEVAGGLEAIFLTYSTASADGYFSLGVTEATSPDLVFRDHTGVTVFKLSDEASTYQATVTGDLRVTDDATISGDVLAGNVYIGATAAASGEELRVVGQSRMEGSLTVTTGGISVTGSSVFTDGLSVTNGDIAINSGSLTVADDLTVSDDFQLETAWNAAGITLGSSSNGRLFVYVKSGGSWVQKKVPYYD